MWQRGPCVQAVLGAHSPRAPRGSEAAGWSRQVGTSAPRISRGLCGSAPIGRGTECLFPSPTRAQGESKGLRLAGMLPGWASVEPQHTGVWAPLLASCVHGWWGKPLPCTEGRSLGPDPPRLRECWLGVTARHPRRSELWVQPHFCASGDSGCLLLGAGSLTSAGDSTSVVPVPFMETLVPGGASRPECRGSSSICGAS